MFCKNLLTGVSRKLHLMCRALSVFTHLQMILCFSNRGLLFIISKVKVFLISHSDNFCTSKINFSCFKCSNPSSASHAQMELEFSFLDWNCHYSITTNQNKAFAPFTFFARAKCTYLTLWLDLCSHTPPRPERGLERRKRSPNVEEGVSSLRKSAFTEFAGVPEPKLENVPLQGVKQTGLVLLQEDGRVLRRSGGGVYSAPGCCGHPGTHGSAAGAELEKKTTMMTWRRCLECKNGEWLGSFNIYT